MTKSKLYLLSSLFTIIISFNAIAKTDDDVLRKATGLLTKETNTIAFTENKDENKKICIKVNDMADFKSKDLEERLSRLVTEKGFSVVARGDKCTKYVLNVSLLASGEILRSVANHAIMGGYGTQVNGSPWGSAEGFAATKASVRYKTLEGQSSYLSDMVLGSMKYNVYGLVSDVEITRVENNSKPLRTRIVTTTKPVSYKLGRASQSLFEDDLVKVINKIIA